MGNQNTKSRSTIGRQAKELMCSYIYPLNIGLSLEPIIGAIAAGNVMVLKPSDQTPACSSVLAKIIPTYLDNKAIKVIEGDYSVGDKLLQQKWDKIFFTGLNLNLPNLFCCSHSPIVGRLDIL